MNRRCRPAFLRPMIRIVEEKGSHRLIRRDDGRCAVIEVRDGRVYSLHGHERRTAADDGDGMAAVVGDGWQDEAAARATFAAVTRDGRHYAETIW